MAKNRIPTIGDRVTALGQKGTFVVYSIDRDVQCAELKLIGKELRLSSIPWSSLTLLEIDPHRK